MQDEANRECAAANVAGKPIDEKVAKAIEAANMKTVIDEPISEWLAANGYFYVMHRFDIDNVAYAKRMRG